MLYAGDIQSAKEEVNAMIRFLGFTPVDRGSLRNAREIEDVPVQRFPNWKNPLIISCLVFGMYNNIFIKTIFIIQHIADMLFLETFFLCYQYIKLL